MNRFNIPLVAEGLTAYAIERLNGIERHQPDGAPPWAEQRRFWTDAVLQGMTRLENREPDQVLMDQYDHEMERTRGFLTIPASPQLQNDTVSELRRYIRTLENTGDDRRRQVNVVRELLEDMASHLPWAAADNALGYARDEADRALVRMTAQMPIRFTRVLLGGDAGPHWMSGFVSGAVMDTEAVKKTGVYAEAVRTCPEITNWPALCTVCVGRGLSSALGTVDASNFDLMIMNRAGDSFLNEQGVRCVGSKELCISTHENIQALKVEPGKAPETVSMPNTLESFQAAVGGYIETLGLDCGVCLICSEGGKLMGLPANRPIGGDIIAGTFLIVGEEDGEFCPLSDADITHYAEKFAQPMPSYTGLDKPTQLEFHVF